MVTASLVTRALWQIAVFAVQSVAVKVHSHVKLECMMAWVSSNDHDRAIPRACLSAMKVCNGRCIAVKFVQHSCNSSAAGDALVERT